MYKMIPRIKMNNFKNFGLIANYSAKASGSKNKKSHYQQILNSEYIFNTLNVDQKTDILSNFPNKLLRKKLKTPESFYIVNEKSAELISETLLNDLPNIPILEINPGPGLLTRKLLENNNLCSLHVCEYHSEFMPYLETLKQRFPKRINIKSGDFINSWKLAYRDKLDNGNRLQKLLSSYPKKEYTDDVNIRIFAGIGSYNFFKHLINALVFQTGFLSYGRCELYLVLPPPLYIHLTCNNEIGYLVYRATSMLFQIMFEHKFITKIPRENFLPWQHKANSAKSSKLAKINSIDPDSLYFIKILPRKNLYTICPLEDMPAFWYFVKQNCVSRKNRIIPNLEKWIPGCGPRLIVNSNKSENITNVYDKENIKNLPLYSTRCTTISRKNYMESLNLFSQFGDLTPSQILTLFWDFRNWPEYKHSPFLASLENCLLKMESDSADGLDINESDDSGTDEKIELIK